MPLGIGYNPKTECLFVYLCEAWMSVGRNSIQMKSKNLSVSVIFVCESVLKRLWYKII